MNLTAKSGQDIISVVVASYGSVDFLFDFLSKNKLDVNTDLLPGTQVTVPDAPLVSQVQYSQVATPQVEKKKRIVNAGQNVLDLAIRHYGSVEGVFFLLGENAWLNINSVLIPGQVLNVQAETKANRDVVSYFERRGEQINTGDDAGMRKLEGVGYWIVEQDNIVQ